MSDASVKEIVDGVICLCIMTVFVVCFVCIIRSRFGCCEHCHTHKKENLNE